MNNYNIEKSLKRYLKKRIGYSIAIFIFFMINGSISLSADINTEAKIQQLLREIKKEKNLLEENILEIEKKISSIENLKYKDKQVFFSILLEGRKSHDYSDNGFDSQIDDDGEGNIDIPDLISPIRPDIPVIKNPLPNEDQIVKIPSFEFESVSEIEVKIPNEIELSFENLNLPVNEIKDENFNILDGNNISTPIMSDDEISIDVTNPDIDINIKTEIVRPEINNVNELLTFEIPEIEVEVGDIIVPESFSMSTVKIETGSFKQDKNPSYITNEKTKSFYVFQNYSSYKADDRGFNIWFNEKNIFYDNGDRGDNPKKDFYLQDINKTITYGGKNGYTEEYDDKLLVTTFISDAIDNDANVEGDFHFTYEGNRKGNIDDKNKDYVRIFISSSSQYMDSSSKEKTKLTEFVGELNLATTDDGAKENKYKDEKLNGNLIGLEHQIWDYDNDKNSILLNSGKINIGNNINRDTNIIKAVNKNMIGIMIDSAKSSSEDKKESNKTINSGEINIMKPEYNTSTEEKFTPRNNIGISFEEYEAGNVEGAVLRDEVYIGKINIGKNTKNNYGLKMGNIYNNSDIYFDETKIIGKVDGDKVFIDNDDSRFNGAQTNIKTDEDGKKYVDYVSDIIVDGTQNVGIIVGKSLSKEKNINPIANFENISIKINGEQTIGFVRDRNYSDNNINDMIITEENFKSVTFGNDAKNSVLFRSEQYGITNNKKLEIGRAESKEENVTEDKYYNVVMQATKQSWDKNEDGINDINSVGTVTNNGSIITGENKTVNNMIGLMASGKTEFGIDKWQNNIEERNSKVTNSGEIILNGNNNIGIAITDDNEGSQEENGKISITGENALGIYSTGTFTGKGNISVDGKNAIGIYNKQETDKINRIISDATLNLDGITINIADNSGDKTSNGAVGIYSEEGTVNFGNIQENKNNEISDGTTINGEENAIVGFYGKGNVSTNGNLTITGTKTGIVSENGTVSINGNISYSGDGFALYTKNNGKIEFTENSTSTLTLGGNAYGFDIDSNIKGEVNFNGQVINIVSNNVTVFNINAHGEDYSSKNIGAGEGNLPGEDYLKQFIGEFKINNESNGKIYNGYKLASIENGIINLDSTSGNNEEFIKKYKFQKSIVNMSTETVLDLTNNDADTYFNGEAIGIGLSSNHSREGEEQTRLEDTQINISDTLTINRKPNSKNNSEEENNISKSTIGAYINYGEVNLGYISKSEENGKEEYKKGSIVVEKSSSESDDIVYDNGIGIYSKNGSKITVGENSSITVYGNNGIGIYAEATKDIYKDKNGNDVNKFGGEITQININNSGTIDISNGQSGVGIYADGGNGDIKGTVINSGDIKVAGGAENNSSVGIYGVNTNITNNGNITVGCNDSLDTENSNTENHAGVGIYAENSNVIAGGTITLGDFSTGIYLDGNSNFIQEESDSLDENNLTFDSLEGNITSRIGIYVDNKNRVDNNISNDINLNFNINMENVIGGKAIVAEERKVVLSEGNKILISHNNGRGMRALNNATIINNGEIIVGSKVPLSTNEDNKEYASIGMSAGDKNGVIENNGTITVNSDKGIGIYVNNSDESEKIRDGNSVNSIGNINLNSNNSIGVVLKEANIILDGKNNIFGNDIDGEKGNQDKGINFDGDFSDRIGIYTENGTITVNEKISKKINGAKSSNNILLAASGENGKIENNEIIEIVSNGADNLHNIGVYLKDGATYFGIDDENVIEDEIEKGTVIARNGAIGIYADKEAKILENIKVISDSQGVQTIGVVLNGENKEDKNIYGEITLTNTSKIDANGKNIGIYANNSKVIVNDIETKDAELIINNDNSNGTGLYLNNSTLFGNGTIKITGSGKVNENGENKEIPNSVGIYYNTSDKDNPIISNNEIKVQIEKSNTIGVYVSEESSLTKGPKGEIQIGMEGEKVTNVTGLVAGKEASITNEGKVLLSNTEKSIGIAGLGGNKEDKKTVITNKGEIILAGSTTSDTGIFISGNSELNNDGKIIIRNDKKDGNENKGLGIGIYTKGKDVTINSVGDFDMAEGNVAIYSDGTNISNDINLLVKNELGENLTTNSGTIALVVKSDRDSTEKGITEDTTVGGIKENNERMKITLAQDSTGIYALDSGVSISNVSIDATSNGGKDFNDMSYGIYLNGKIENESSEAESYEISNTDISIVKGIGIVLNSKLHTVKDNFQERDILNLSGSTLNIDSYSEGNKAETGIGIYTQNGNINLVGGNTINVSYGVGILGEAGSSITTGNEDKFNLQGYSVGVYSKGGDITLGNGTTISFNKGIDNPVNNKDNSGSTDYQGTGAYVIDGNITSDAEINIGDTNGNIVKEVTGLLGKQNSDTEMSITNNGTVNLFGKSVIGMVGLGKEDTANKLTLINEGNISISGVEKNISVGIYGENTSINNNGIINIGEYATGIYYKGTRDNNIFSNDITLNGENSNGIVLNGVAGNVEIGNIIGEKNRNLGVYLNNYSAYNTKIGNISLGNESMGLYINESNAVIESVGDISVGDDGIGIAVVGDKEENNLEDDIITIENHGNIKAGNHGRAIYVENSTLNMDTLAGIDTEDGGVVLHIKNGTLNLDRTVNELEFAGKIGMILEDGANITSENGSIENIKVLNGGTGIIIKGEQTSAPSIFNENTTITLGSGDYNEATSEGEYSVGIYYQNASDIKGVPKIKIAYKEGASHTIGAIYDRTYGKLTVNENDITMDNSINNSIGVIIRRDTDDKNDNGESNSVTLIAENEVPLIKVDGNHNIGVIGKDSIINTVGDIEVGLVETSQESIGIYLTGTTDKIEHNYNGNGNINVGSHSYGIYAKNYNVSHTGDITVNGSGSIGIANIIERPEGHEHGHPHSIIINESKINVNSEKNDGDINGAIGIYGKETNIAVKDGDISVSGIHGTGIASVGNGNIEFTGKFNIQGEGSIGIYKDTVLGKYPDLIENNTIKVSKSDWIVGNEAAGIYVNSRIEEENGDIIQGSSVIVENNANMDLGNGAIGIYMSGDNTLTNNGDINVGEGIHLDDGTDISSIGIYMANGLGGTTATGLNNGEIFVGGNGSVGIHTAGYVDFVNEGKISVADKGSGIGALATYESTITNEGQIFVTGENSIGMLARENSKVVNNNEITVNGSGIAMAANGSGAVAENNGTIKLELPNGEDTELNSSMIGMGAFDGGHIINTTNGKIYAGAGIGMYVDESSSLTNDGYIEVSNGIGILGNGHVTNSGTINITGSGKDVVDGELSDIENGSIIINDIDRIVEINDNFSNIGGIIETDYDMHLNNPTVDITQGGAGFDAPNISGEIKLDSNFALEGNGISYTVEDFIDKDADIKVNTSILFNPEISEDGDLTVTKNPYKDISVGDFDERDNALDEILANGSSGMDALKNLNYYLNNIGNPDILRNEYERAAEYFSGSEYANIQSRMQDINRTFDNSFDEMVKRDNLAYENDKYSMIYTNGDYKNTRKGVLDYSYNIAGLNYMKEYEELELNKKYGYEFGFAGSKFKFQNSESEEKIYSLRGGIHQVKNLENGISILSRAEIGYNRHDMDREISIGGDTYKNSSDFNSYQISIDNKARKSIYKDEKVDLGIYTGLNLEYGIFDDVKDHGEMPVKVKSNDYLSSKAFVGFDAEAVKNLKDDWAVRITGDVNYSYDFGNNYDENEVKLGENYISLLSELESRDVVSGKVSVALDKSDYMTIALEGNLSKDFNRDEDYWNVGLRFTYVFGNDKFPTEFLNMKNYFDFDKSELNSEGKIAVKEMSEYLDKKHIKGTVLIEGHSDSVGEKNYNQKLSEKRAETVKKEFQKNIKSNDIDFITKGYGERKPIATNDTKDGRTQNRRTEINLINRQ